MRRIQELELENALPERREAAKERKKVLRDVQNHSDSNTWLQNKVVELVRLAVLAALCCLLPAAVWLFDLLHVVGKTGIHSGKAGKGAHTYAQA